MKPVKLIEGNSPIILAFPHVGTHVPQEIFEKLNARGQSLSDTDWHVDRLYDGLIQDATMVIATFHRYVIDANRDPAGVSLYPGQNTTSLCPTTDFDGQAIWRSGEEPDEEEVISRRLQFHQPYHETLRAAIDRVKAKHGFAVLYDCHSIRSHIPFLFDGKLPDFNIGTNQGTTCDLDLQQHVVDTCEQAESYTHVLNGRFKGGWTTRNYANPADNVHVIQMELAQSTYASECDPWEYHETKAAKLRPVLAKILKGLEEISLVKFSKT